MKRVHVVAAVIRGTDGRVLIAKRSPDRHQGGLWEFPGGKVEEGESAYDALGRELAEEVSIQVIRARPLIQINHDYPDKHVLLDVWEVEEFSGEAEGLEGQPLAWVNPRRLPEYDFPAANGPIVSAARLPDRYLVTPDGLETGELLNGVRKAIAGGISLIQLRTPSNFDPQYRDLATDVQGLCAGKAQLMLKGPLEWLGDFPAAGWHLTSEQLRKYAAKGRPFPPDRWLAASCHNTEELALATRIGADFVTLSPVQATESHPDASPLGWEQTKEAIRTFNAPVFALGGLASDDIHTARLAGAQGIAAIRSLWPDVRRSA
jgi:8-oxo-dGTP diphosphatase